MTLDSAFTPPWRKSGPPSASQNSPAAALAKEKKKAERFIQYQANPLGYLRDVLGIEPWAGRNGKRGQLELVQDIGKSVARQLAGDVHAP